MENIVIVVIFLGAFIIINSYRIGRLENKVKDLEYDIDQMNKKYHEDHGTTLI